MDEKVLEDLGFSKAEIRVYLALLEIGESTSGGIISKSGLQSSVVHRVLKTLLEKGLVSFVLIGKNKNYSATDPKNLVDFVENKKKRIQDLIPELEMRKKSSEKNYSAEMFLGKRAMFSVLNNLIADANKGEDYLSFSLIEPHDDKEIVDFYHSYNLRRREKNLKVKVLVNKEVKQIYEKNYTKDLLKKANVRYTTFHFPQGIILFRNNVVFIHWGENPFAIKIINEQMSSQFKEFFLEFYNKEKNAY